MYLPSVPGSGNLFCQSCNTEGVLCMYREREREREREYCLKLAAVGKEKIFHNKQSFLTELVLSHVQYCGIGHILKGR